MLKKKRFWGLLLLTAVLGICCSRYVSLLYDFDAMGQVIHSAGSWKVCVFMAAHTLAAAVGIPGTLLVMLGGATFGVVWGTLWSVLGATAGAVVAFLLARYLLHDWISQRLRAHPRFGKTYRRLNQTIKHRSLTCVLAVRFAPISPFNVVNFLFGLTAISLTPYAVGTLLGIIPGTLAYTWLGVAGLEAAQGKGWWPLAAGLMLLALLSLLPVYVQRRQ